VGWQERLSRLITNIWGASTEPTMWGIISCHTSLAQSYQILFNYCSDIAPEKREPIMQDFIDGYPIFLTKLIKDKGQTTITNTDILDKLLYA
jgi:hypothetical protein